MLDVQEGAWIARAPCQHRHRGEYSSLKMTAQQLAFNFLFSLLWPESHNHVGTKFEFPTGGIRFEFKSSGSNPTGNPFGAFAFEDFVESFGSFSSGSFGSLFDSFFGGRSKQQSTQDSSRYGRNANFHGFPFGGEGQYQRHQQQKRQAPNFQSQSQYQRQQQQQQQQQQQRASQEQQTSSGSRQFAQSQQQQTTMQGQPRRRGVQTEKTSVICDGNRCIRQKV